MSGIQQLNNLSSEMAEKELFRCCGSANWVRAMATSRPFRDRDHLFSRAGEIWRDLTTSDYLEAFKQHPRIGNTGPSASKWSQQEQKNVGAATPEQLNELAKLNHLYENQFGFVFLICATGKTSGEMLEQLKTRLNYSREEELKTAAVEQEKITRLRLERLLTDETELSYHHPHP